MWFLEGADKREWEKGMAPLDRSFHHDNQKYLKYTPKVLAILLPASDGSDVCKLVISNRLGLGLKLSSANI